MENKEDIVKRLKLLLIATRAGSNIADLILTENQSKVIVVIWSRLLRFRLECQRVPAEQYGAE